MFIIIFCVILITLYRYNSRFRKIVRFESARVIKKMTGNKNYYSHQWFKSGVEAYSNEMPLHHASQWKYMSLEEWSLFVQTIISYLRPEISNNASIFEVGVGAGAFLKSILDIYPNVSVSGIDPLSKAVRIAKTVIPNGKFFVGSGLNLSRFQGCSYDHVIANFVISYLNNLKEAQRFLFEMMRITKPGGSLMLTCMVEPGGKSIGSGNIYIPKTWWKNACSGYTITSIQNMGEWNGFQRQGDRYAVYLEKNSRSNS